MKRWAIAIGALLLAAQACGDDETSLSQNSPIQSDAGVGGTSPKSDASKPDAPTIKPKRTVFTRNPFGNVAASDNLIWDGDFEWFSAFAEQYGWVDAAQLIGVAAFNRVRVSTECKSGMRCGVMTQNQRIAAIGVAAAGGANVEAGVWIKMPTSDCVDMHVALISCDFGDVDPDVVLTDADNKPDATGWCHFHAVSPGRKRATCLTIEARFAEGEALIDDAVVRATSDAPTPSESAPSDAASSERFRVSIREYMKPRPPEKSRAHEAIERWLGRRR
jgi:hypothetical protein